MSGEPPQLAFESAEAWQDWLGEHQTDEQGVWLELARAGGGAASLTHAEALDVALCHGWIDGQRRRLDDSWWLQRFTPRRPRSIWSRRNRERALELMAAGRMTPAGLAEVERARADGRWDAAYDGPARATVPDDLRAALEASPAAAARFQTLDGRNRYAILYRVQTAKKPETRARRIAQFVEMLADGRTLYP